MWCPSCVSCPLLHAAAGASPFASQQHSLTVSFTEECKPSQPLNNPLNSDSRIDSRHAHTCNSPSGQLLLQTHSPSTTTHLTPKLSCAAARPACLLPASPLQLALSVVIIVLVRFNIGSSSSSTKASVCSLVPASEWGDACTYGEHAASTPQQAHLHTLASIQEELSGAAAAAALCSLS